MPQVVPTKSQPLMSLDEGALRLGISRMGVYRLIEAGDLPRVKIGKRALLDPADVDRLIERSKTAGLARG